MKCAAVLHFWTPEISVMLRWSQPQLWFGDSSFSFLYHAAPWSVLVMSDFPKGHSGWSPCLSCQWISFLLASFPLYIEEKNYSVFVVTTREAPIGAGSMMCVSVVSERATFLLRSPLLWSSFDWKYFACLTTCWWIFLCQVMCQELAEHSKLITCVHTVKEKQTARHQWYEEWDFIAVARDCVVNESAQSAGNW